MSSEKSNVPEYSVSDLAFSLKKTLEEGYGHVRVRGELSRVSIAGSGHMYSSLKDDGAVIDAVCWKGTLNKLSITPEEGLEVICTGRVSSYPARSNYQLIIESMELAGEGALLKMLEERRKKLAVEGLFDEERKKALPFLPEVIGVVTSPTGAVIRDILHRLSDRFPRHVLLWPVLVQGDGAAEQVSNAIKGFDAIKEGGEIPRPDLLIVARGGGSLEDLMPFNEENVVRAVAGCSTPVISAVGHETDTTLCDFAADMRAPTPTGAAEIAVPVRANLQAQILDDAQRLLSAMTRTHVDKRTRLEGTLRGLTDPRRLLEMKTQRLDQISERMSGIFERYIHQKDQKLTKVSASLTHPKAMLDKASERLNRWSEELTRAGRVLLQDREKSVRHASKMLKAYSFKKTLDRGFAVVRSSNGQIISQGKGLQKGEAIALQFKDKDNVEAVIGTGAGTMKKSPSKPKKKATATDQGNLF